MPALGTASKLKMKSLDERLQDILNEAILYTDFSVIWGFRGEESQNKAYNEGHSRLTWPESKHNQIPSTAVDLAPYPINWADVQAFAYLAGVVMTIAAQKQTPVIWGGNWTKLKDLGHFELV